MGYKKLLSAAHICAVFQWISKTVYSKIVMYRKNMCNKLGKIECPRHWQINWLKGKTDGTFMTMSKLKL